MNDTNTNNFWLLLSCPIKKEKNIADQINNILSVKPLENVVQAISSLTTLENKNKNFVGFIAIEVTSKNIPNLSPIILSLKTSVTVFKNNTLSYNELTTFINNKKTQENNTKDKIKFVKGPFKGLSGILKTRNHNKAVIKTRIFGRYIFLSTDISEISIE